MKQLVLVYNIVPTIMEEHILDIYAEKQLSCVSNPRLRARQNYDFAKLIIRLKFFSQTVGFLLRAP